MYNLIDYIVSCNEGSFYFSFVYGHPNSSFRQSVWEIINRIRIGRRNQPWILLGDFNEILDNHENI